MANKPSTDKPGQSSTLQRGKACLRCRKRKMRCDGAKPACQQCTRAKKGDGCEYDDGRGKTRTQLLKETIAKLEQRVRELEDPTNSTTAVMLFDPHHDPSYSGSSPSSFDSPDSTYLSAFPHSGESSASPSASWTQLQSIPSPMTAPLLPNIFFDEQQSPFQPPADIALMLLDIFAPHSRQCGLEIDMDRLRNSLSLPLSEQRHPTFMNALYLWACCFSRPEALSQYEDQYLRASLEALPDALRTSRFVDVIQASCLLATYFLANGRLHEGSYHASAAAALADQIGLGGQQQQQRHGDSKSGSRIEADRVSAFWQVYNLDRCWSVILQKQTLLSDGPHPRAMITCPWPRDVSDYKLGALSNGNAPTIQAFLAGSVCPDGFSSAALRVKASALFARADRLAAEWCPGLKISAQLIDEINSLEHAIALFLSTLIQVEQLDAVLPEEKHSTVVAYTLAQTAMIYLHRPFAAENPMSAEKCNQAARACISTFRYINERDFAFLDPIVGPCWSAVAEHTISRLDTLERTWPLADTSDVINDLGILLYAMTKLSNHFPVIAPALSRVQKRLA